MNPAVAWGAVLLAAWSLVALGIGYVLGRCMDLPDMDDEFWDDVPVSAMEPREIDARFRHIVGTRSTFEGLL